SDDFCLSMAITPPRGFDEWRAIPRYPCRTGELCRPAKRERIRASRSLPAMPDIVRQPGARLTGQVDPRLPNPFYAGPLANLRRTSGAFHAFDKAHTVALTEAGLVPRDAACAILSGLREMEAEGIEAVRDSMGGGRHSGEAYLTGKLGAGTAGWINLG